MLFDDDDVDNVDTFTDDDRAAYDAEARGEVYEQSPEPSPEVVAEKEDLSRQLAEERERFARLDERRIAREEAEAPTRQQELQGPPTRLGQRPDAYIDPFGADIWDARRETELVSMRLEEQQRSAEQREFADWIERDASQFRAQHPDYQQAADHAYRFRLNHWIGLGVAEQHARAIVDQEALATAKFARQSGKSPSAQFYELAKQVGYQPGAAQTVAKGQPQSRQRQSAPAPAREKPQARSGRISINTLSESQLEQQIRRDPKGVTRALERLEFSDEE